MQQKRGFNKPSGRKIILTLKNGWNESDSEMTIVFLNASLAYKRQILGQSGRKKNLVNMTTGSGGENLNMWGDVHLIHHREFALEHAKQYSPSRKAQN